MKGSFEEELRQLVTKAFEPDGWLVQQGMHYLAAQTKYAEAVTEWLLSPREQSLGFLEAETGTGKTLGYLIPLMLYTALSGKRVGVATFSIFLQNQILAEDGDFERTQRYIQSCSLGRVAVGQYLGKIYYIDPHRVRLRVAELADEGRVTKAHADMIAWADHHAEFGSGLTSEWIAMYDCLPEGITENSVGCQHNSTPALLAARETVQNAQLVLTSHAALVCDAVFRGSLLSADDDSVSLSAVVIDEGDQLETAAAGILQKRLQPLHMVSLCERIAKHHSGQERGKVTRAANCFSKLNAALVEIGSQGQTVTVWQQLHRDVQENLLRLLADCRESVSRVAALKHNGVPETHELQSALPVINALLDSTYKGVNAEIAGLSWSPTRRYPSLMVQPVDPLRRITYGWSKEDRPRMLLTSATLSGQAGLPDFKDIRRKMWAPNAAVAVEGSYAPEHFGTMNFVLPDSRTMPGVFIRDDEGEDETVLLNAEWLRAVAKMIGDAMKDGRTLVICSSYREAEAIGKYLASDDAIVHSSGTSLRECTAAFCRGVGRVLISPACWEGVSLRYTEGRMQGKQAFDQCVITRIPFVPPSPWNNILAQFMVDSGEVPTLSAANSRLGAKLTQGVRRRLRQGFGRGIRHRDDCVTVWIADGRFPNGKTQSRWSVFLGAISPRFLAAFRAARIWSPDASTAAAPSAPPKKRLFA